MYPGAHAAQYPDKPAVLMELLEFVRARIARYESPRSIDLVQERSPTGKLVKHVPRKQYAEAPASPEVAG